ncbi:hypothetical protein LOK49_LG05G00071 [Camellia lanceoleosa]|uniref:Uncharacterized protein n=1 Tax=Camellia lanceoleosa TaxID=1840588 RepID=A0ACC0HM41_9ERIC|nr:hypothetical protein LOK49_LG05G00071 [Camellia lanceoleosa]
MDEKMGTRGDDGIEVILRRFGDEQSTLLDRFERLSFEVQLNQAILGRSLSEPSVSRGWTHHHQAPPAALLVAPPAMASQVQQGKRRHGSGFQKVLKRLLKPILRRRWGSGKKESPDPKDPMFWKTFSRSMRV